MTSHVAILIVGFRNAEDIGRCLQAIDRQTHKDLEVVICENGGPEGYAALTASLPATLPGGQKITAIQASGNLGYGGGINVGLRHTPEADAWWVLNPDTQPQPEALAAMLARLSVGDCEAVGCTLFRPNGRIQSYAGKWLPWLARPIAIGHAANLDDPVDVKMIEREQTYMNGASILVGRRFMEVVGPMREDYFIYCEDTEWCTRASARGMRLGFAPGAFVMHELGSTTGEGEEIRGRPRLPVYLMERNKMLFTRDQFPTRMPVAALSAFGLLIMKYARRGAWKQFGVGVSGWWAGLRDERGPPPWIAA